jgi:hypothetical protein
MSALDLCNACDRPIETPNPMGYCNACLKAMECTCGRGEGHHHPDCPQWDGHVDNYDQEEPKS